MHKTLYNVQCKVFFLHKYLVVTDKRSNFAVGILSVGFVAHDEIKCEERKITTNKILKSCLKLTKK